MNSPQAIRLMNEARNRGMSYKQLFMQQAQQQGINPNDIIGKVLNSYMNR